MLIGYISVCVCVYVGVRVCGVSSKRWGGSGFFGVAFGFAWRYQSKHFFPSYAKYFQKHFSLFLVIIKKNARTHTHTYSKRDRDRASTQLARFRPGWPQSRAGEVAKRIAIGRRVGGVEPKIDRGLPLEVATARKSQKGCNPYAVPLPDPKKKVYNSLKPLDASAAWFGLFSPR